MPPTLKKINGVYHARVNAAGRVKWVSTQTTTKPEAEKVLAESGVNRLNTAAKAGRLTQKAIGQILTGRNLTCAKALEAYVKQRSASRSASTVTNTVVIVQQWLRECKLETTAPSAITPEQIGDWLNDPQSGWKRSTRLAALGSLRSFWDFCAVQGWVAGDPSRLVEVDHSVLSHQQKEPTEKEPFTEIEINTLCRRLEEDIRLREDQERDADSFLFRDVGHSIFWLLATRIAQETGLRLSDIAQLEWRCFGEPGLLVVWTEKTNQRLEHKISKVVQELISLVPINDVNYVFPEQREIIKDMKRRSGLSMQFGRLLERLDIRGKSFHSLRHYRATAAYAGVNKAALAKKLAEALTIDEIRALLGHKDAQTTRGYIH